jgi:hypothetical protein
VCGALACAASTGRAQDTAIESPAEAGRSELGTPEDSAAVRVRLDYRENVGRGCPDRAEFEELVASRMGYAPFDEHARGSIEVVLEGRAPVAATGTIRILDIAGLETGRRTIATPAPCQEIAESLATAIAILLESVSSSGAPSEVPPLPPEQPGVVVQVGAAPPAPSPPPWSAPSPAPAPRSGAPLGPIERASNAVPVRFGAGASFLGEAGTTADPTMGARVALGLHYSVVEVLLEGSISSQLSPTRLPSGDTLESFTYNMDLAVCLHAGVIGACALGGVGALHATVRNVSLPMGRTSLVAFVGARVLGTIRLGEVVRLRPWVELVGVPARAAIVVDGRTVFEGSLVSGRLGLELGIEIQ